MLYGTTGYLFLLVRRIVPLDPPQNRYFAFLALTFILAPLPNAVFAHCGSDEYSEGSGPIDLGRFITSIIVISGFALPIILAHSEVIDPKACVMSIIGGGYVSFMPKISAFLIESHRLVYGTILAYSAAFSQEDSEYD